jgi:two-component system response regulator RegA
MDASVSTGNDQPDILLVDDDAALCDALGRALTRHGFRVATAHTAAAAIAKAETNVPEYAVVDLMLPDQSGLKVVSRLIAIDPHTRIVVLTGNASVPTAVAAIKLGAVNYLMKPVTAGEILLALRQDGVDEDVTLAVKPMSVSRVEWEHIQRVLLENNGNISATARALSLHRRTLQRKLAKNPAHS